MTLSQRLPIEVPAAIAPLSVLPVFLSLAGKSAIVVGGSPAAAWKAELLASAGATVAVVADAPSPEMESVILRAGGHIALTDAALAELLEAGPAVVVADAGDDAEADTIAAHCRTLRVPLNVIDRPAFCDFQFGTIVNRSPVVIGIATTGAAPILGQAIRQRIEALLPAGLAAWAGRAAAVRERVMRLLPAGPSRRRFWEAFVERAFGGALPGEGVEDLDPRRWIGGEGEPRVGRVTLVGAGPGDAAQLTLQALRALQSADVILYDDLVTPEVLELARREAKRIAVGKRGGGRSCRQDDINALLVQLAGAGNSVVRLKSGDPSVFGRAGEEIDACAAVGIPVEVVPGITAASALAARLGISLTHRDGVRSVRFVTGHASSGALPEDLDWRGLADAHTSLVVYMGGATAAPLARRLIRHGLDPSTPLVVAEAVSRPDERIVHGVLRDLARGSFAFGHGPVLLGVGAVFARRETSPDPARPEAAISVAPALLT
ncbi:MAG: siroheme synthase CysG [Bauldia sp.]|nr:siroheme synthase CysG [Bauldia sp.]